MFESLKSKLLIKNNISDTNLKSKDFKVDYSKPLIGIKFLDDI